MNDQSKLFEEELARRNPDWEKIVAVHNAALAAEREKQQSDSQYLVEKESHLRDDLALAVQAAQIANKQLVAERGRSENWKHNSERYEAELAAEREKYAAFEKYALEQSAEADKTIEQQERFKWNANKRADDAEQQLAAERERAEASEYNFGVQVDETKRLTAELERERMCHAACGVIAMSNTPESLAKNRDMKPEYLSASVQDCIRAIERELALREQLAAEREKIRELEERLRKYET